MKRVKNLFEKLITDENIELAIKDVNKTHLFSHGRFNKTAVWVEQTKPERIKELRQIILDGFMPKKPKEITRYDYAAQKTRDIKIPSLWPD